MSDRGASELVGIQSQLRQFDLLIPIEENRFVYAFMFEVQ